MELISFHRYIKNTYTSGMICTEHLLNIDKRPQLSKRARKAQHNEVGQKNKETKNKRERHWMGPVSRGGSCEGGKVPASWEVFSPVQTGVTEGISRDRGKTPVCGGQESYLHRQLALPPRAPHPEVLIHWYGQQLGPEAQASGQTQGEDWGCLWANSLKR